MICRNEHGRPEAKASTPSIENILNMRRLSCQSQVGEMDEEDLGTVHCLNSSSFLETSARIDSQMKGIVDSSMGQSFLNSNQPLDDPTQKSHMI